MRSDKRKVPTGAARLPSSRLSIKAMEDLPDDDWVKTVVDGINDVQIRYDSLTTQQSIDLQSFSNIQIKKIRINVPNPWVNATLLGTWVTHKDALRYAKLYDGSVELIGSITGGVAASNICIIPNNAGPKVEIQIPVAANAAYGQIQIVPNGLVKHVGGATTNIFIHSRWMPSDNVPQPLSCFPIDVLTRFAQKPAFVLAVLNKKQADSAVTSKFRQAPMVPSWEYIMGRGQPKIQILDIPGLEYDTMQQVTLFILGS